ncbi:HAD-IA family hydrolase [Pseudoprimorskyibacter insulae]|uniref:phosphoglycolate phosphatase n=1 Tax=Pseudoprimorskyibacter insulae TaxID=1695997 RepID=A0A2R8AX44_9RHOB|nr:HAD-IA family hydrolase [Pseudoprimorskyibacter insulae]SPF80568.1 Phosphoglycolate phosphatase [Pseudoprimorskyibacter insulae]
MTRTVIFDLDGTLADTSADLIAAANYCFERLDLGQPLDPVADARTAFRGARAMLTLGLERRGQFSADLVEAWYPELLVQYGREIDVHTRLYDGAMEAVEALKSDGFRVGICTNKPEGLADTLLRRLGVLDAFHSMIGADTLPVRKPNPTPYFEAVQRAGGDAARSILIGDTETDRETARAASVPCVLVTFGPDGHGVSALKSEAYLNHFNELPDLAARLLA